MPWLNESLMPENPRDAAAWDTYWQAVLRQHETGTNGSQELYLGPLRINERDDLLAHHADTFEYYGLRRVLFAGNGLSAVPYLYKHRGFSATALDISAVATEYSRNTPPDELDALRFFGRPPNPIPMQDPEFKQRAEEAMEREARPGGSLSFITADLFDWHCPDGSWDVIVLQKVVDRYPHKADRRELAQRCFRWLRPGGMIVVESYFLKFYYPEMKRPFGAEAEFERAGFRLHLREYTLWHRTLSRFFYNLQWGKASAAEKQRKQAWYDAEWAKRYYGNAAEDFELAQKGQRLAIFQYGTSAADLVPATAPVIAQRGGG